MKPQLFMLSIGAYGGFYWHKSETSTRLCLGHIAFTWIRGLEDGAYLTKLIN